MTKRTLSSAAQNTSIIITYIKISHDKFVVLLDGEKGTDFSLPPKLSDQVQCQLGLTFNNKPGCCLRE